MDEVTSIEIPQLMALGDDVTEIGSRFGRAVAEIEGWRGAATGAVDGSVTSQVQLGLTADNWRSTLQLLAHSIQDHGRSLHQAAADYRTADEAAGKRIGQSGESVATAIRRAAGEMPR